MRGRPTKRWVEDIEEDIQALGIRGWRKLSKERTEWRRITERLKPTVGCNGNKRRRRRMTRNFCKTTNLF
jgi:hypothetical protein